MTHCSGTVTIDLIEGQGIWLNLSGPLVDGTIDQLTKRLDRLSHLAFTTVIMDVRHVPMIDLCGIALVRQFIRDIDTTGGTVHSIDPTRLLRVLGDPRTPGFIESMTPPTGPWWTTRPKPSNSVCGSGPTVASESRGTVVMFRP